MTVADYHISSTWPLGWRRDRTASEAEADTAGRDREDELAAGVTGVVADHVGERGRWDRSIDGDGPGLELW